MQLNPFPRPQAAQKQHQTLEINSKIKLQKKKNLLRSCGEAAVYVHPGELLLSGVCVYPRTAVAAAAAAILFWSSFNISFCIFRRLKI